MTLSANDLDYLDAVGARGVALDLSELDSQEDERFAYPTHSVLSPDRTPDEEVAYLEKRLIKLNRLIGRMRERVGDDDRLRVHYRPHDNGRLICQPNILQLPYGFVEAASKNAGTQLLEVGFPIEAIVWLRLLGESDLAKEYTQNGKTSTEILRENFPNATSNEIQYLKLSLFKSFYGAPPKGDDEAQAQSRLRERWPRIYTAATREERKETLAPKVMGLSTKLALAIGRAADSLPGTSTVGFRHGEPLIEYSGDDLEGTTQKLLDLSYGLIQFWNPLADEEI
jgi:hypothetical protein